MPRDKRRSSPAPPLRTPRQARSRDTLRRIVEAARRLLEQRSFEQISVTEITKRARSSVGAFYTRFSGKDALLDHLAELHAAEAARALEALSDPARWPRAPLAEVVEALVDFLVRSHRERPGLLRTLIVEARRGRIAPSRERAEGMRAGFRALLELLLARREEIGHPEPRRAVPLGLAMVTAALREAILFPDALPEGAFPADDAELTQELTRAYLAYLGVAPRS